MKTSKTKKLMGTSSMKTGRLFQTLCVMPAILFFTATPLQASDKKVKNIEKIEKVDDATISSEVKTSLLYHLSLNFEVITNAGVVTLSGNADNIAERDLNTKLAKEIKGVKSVVNNMVIPVTVAKND